jgi:hypothetical protein
MRVQFASEQSRVRDEEGKSWPDLSIFYGDSATRVANRNAKQRASIVGLLIAAAVTVLVAVTESRLTADQHVRNF